MKTYDSLRNLCAFWMMSAFIVGALLSIGSAIFLMRGNLSGLLGIAAGFLLVLTSQTIVRVIDVFIDIALYLQTISTQRADSTKRRLPPQLEK